MRMMKGRFWTEHKCIGSEQAKSGVAALLTPDPKAKCQVENLKVENGRFAQTLSCSQKKGTPPKVSRDGSYDAAGSWGA